MTNFSSIAKLMANPSLSIADHVSSTWYCALLLLAFILLGGAVMEDDFEPYGQDLAMSGSLNLLQRQPCDEIYVVGEGETLHTISDKCSDPFIIERNPHIHDPDDVFPGLVIKITPYPLW